MGGRRKMLLTSALVLLSLALLSVPTSAECPNGCSGNGACLAKDMCQCYKNFQGNDCMDRTCQFGYAHADTPKGDIDYDQNRLTPNWILTDSQQAPSGTYEYFNPSAAQNEAHFYMECSNKGLCDRSLGVCTCFDGYEGVACQRAACPNKCSGHGTCESVRELGLKAPGTLFGIPDKSATISYDLWDSRVTYGCRCDPWYHGADCSLRSCKVGVDPMFLAVGSAVYEVFVVHVYTTGTWTADTTSPVSLDNYFRLRLFDYHGESYITDAIPIVTDYDGTAAVSAAATANADAVAAAIKKIPNLTFNNLDCEPTGLTVGTDLAGYKHTRATSKGLSVVCQFYKNPGRLRAPEVAVAALKGSPVVVSKVFTMEDGTDNEWFTTSWGTLTGSPITNTGSNVFTVASGNTVDAAIKLFKLGSHVVVGKLTPATTLTLTYPIKHTLSTTSIQRFDVATGTGFAVTEIAVKTGGTAVEAVKITVTADPALAAGDLIFYENQFYGWTSVTVVTAGAEYDVFLDRPFVGNSVDGTAGTILFAYKVTPPGKTYQYNYVSPCAGRGLCTTETGVCACFKGYTNDNCDTQNILAL